MTQFNIYGDTSPVSSGDDEDYIAYIEVNGQLGYQYGDTRVNIGDAVPIGVTVYIGLCRAW